jgi:hypothetical protein
MRKSLYNRPLTIALSEKLFSSIKEKSDAADVSYAEWIRQALYCYLDLLKKSDRLEQTKEVELNRKELFQCRL